MVQDAGRLGGQARAARMTPAQRSEGARRAAVARWSRYVLQTRQSGAWNGGWTDDGLGDGNTPGTLAETRGSLEACLALIPTDPSWAAEYRIVRLDAAGEVAEVVEYHDASRVQ